MIGGESRCKNKGKLHSDKGIPNGGVVGGGGSGGSGGGCFTIMVQWFNGTWKDICGDLYLRGFINQL